MSQGVWREVVRFADREFDQRAALGHVEQSKVGQLDVSVLAEQDVGERECPVHNAVEVEVG